MIMAFWNSRFEFNLKQQAQYSDCKFLSLWPQRVSSNALEHISSGFLDVASVTFHCGIVGSGLYNSAKTSPHHSHITHLAYLIA